MTGAELLDTFTELPAAEQRVALIHLSLHFPAAFAEALDAAS